MVAYGHLGGYVPLNLGVSAVVAFYFISGYLMTWSFQSFKASSNNPVKRFNIDRLVRLYPLYAIVFVLTSVLFLISNKHKDAFNIKTLIELLIIPNNFTSFMNGPNIVPTSWSLGAEFQFYLLLPILVITNKNNKFLLLLTLMILQFLVFRLNFGFEEIINKLKSNEFSEIASMINHYCRTSFLGYMLPCKQEISDLFGYRWLPINIVYFLYGHICFELDKERNIAHAIFFSISCADLLLLTDTGNISAHFATEQIWGSLILIPFGLILLDRLKGKDTSPFDRVLGQMAYPLFLVHFLAAWIVEDFNMPGLNLTLKFLIALVLSFLLARLQIRIDRYRYKIRGFARVSS